MKVVLFDLYCTGHHPYWVYFLARYLTEQGDEVSVVTSASNNGVGGPIRRLGKSVNLHYVGLSDHYNGSLPASKRLVNLSRGFRACLDLAEEIRADVVHHMYLDRGILPVYRNVSLRSRPFALFGALLWPYMITDRGEQKTISRRLVHSVESRLLRRMLTQGRLESLFVATDAIKDTLVQAWGAETVSRIVPIPDPVEPVEPIPQARARDELNFPQGISIFAFLGNLSLVKGFDVFLKALPLVSGEWMAVMAGVSVDGGEAQAEACRRLLRSPGQLVTRLGHLPDRELATYLAASDVVVLPYKKSFKGTSGILLNAAATGRPVVACDVNQVGDIVRKQSLGILCVPESPEALAFALEDFVKRRVELAEQVEPRARLFARAHDSRIMAKRIREVYVAVLGRR